MSPTRSLQTVARALSVPAALALLVMAALVSGFDASHAGTTFTVTKTADTADGVCDADCSLREAIIAANALPGDDAITLPASGVPYALTIAGANEDAAATGDLDITDGLSINGAGPMDSGISGSNLDRVFHVQATVVMDGVYIFNGVTNGNGGGIRNEGMLTVAHSRIVWSYANNVGGGIYNSGGTVTLTNSTVSNNTAVGDGGGIYNGGTLYIYNSTVNNNASLGEGGGIRSSGALGLTNSTVTFNNANGDGGGIKLAAGLAALTSVTIAGNLADFENDEVGSGGGISVDSSITVTLRNTIVASNGNCCLIIGFSVPSGFSIPAPDDCSGTITSYGYNLIQETSACTIQNDDSTNLKGISPGSLALADNGGPTLTMALQAGSPAIDAGSPGCTGFLATPTDQRGYVRPVDGDGNGSAICDIGAFEYGSAPPTPVPTPTPTPSPTPTPTPTPTPSPTPTSAANRRQGDVNCDNDILEDDTTHLLTYSARLSDGVMPGSCPDIGDPEPTSGYDWGDVNCDGLANAKDALYDLAYRAGIVLPQNGPNCTPIGSLIT